jgi:hypothetical protein
VTEIAARWTAARENMEKRHMEQVKQAAGDMDYEIAQQKIVNTKKGIDQRLALNELERQRELKRELDSATTTNVGVDRINELYDLKKKQIEQQGFGVFGSFNAAALEAMFPHQAAAWPDKSETNAPDKNSLIGAQGNGGAGVENNTKRAADMLEKLYQLIKNLPLGGGSFFVG